MSDIFRCPDCQTTQKIAARRHKPRKKGHLKRLWCWRCGSVTNQARI